MTVLNPFPNPLSQISSNYAVFGRPAGLENRGVQQTLLVAYNTGVTGLLQEITIYGVYHTA